jgi:hypothetical protein
VGGVLGGEGGVVDRAEEDGFVGGVGEALAFGVGGEGCWLSACCGR